VDKTRYTAFLNTLVLENIVIWGVSSRAKVCYEWITTRYPNAQIIGFLSDVSPDKSSFCNKPILSVDSIKAKPEVAVIYAERNLSELDNLILQRKLKNTFYIFYYVKPYLNTGDMSYPEHEIKAIYSSNDFETQMFFSNFFLAKQHDWSLLIPVEHLEWIAKFNKRYWDKADNDLSVYNALTLIDCGAYTGDSIEDFYTQYGNKFRRAFALEADKTKRTALESTVSMLKMTDSAQIIMKGVSNIVGDFFIENIGTTSGKVVSSGEYSAQTIRIDDLKTQPIGKLCIKMDIEGLEIPALEGAIETIKRYKPEMAICIYHQTADIYEIPAFVRSLCSEYNFIIRGGIHTVCYCSVERFN